ncbi:MAG: DUF4258 domain-containing protein [Acidobacteria bacterium]|nr:DUF4258 domain-containing protein [Acidobacteriota bacterium]
MHNDAATALHQIRLQASKELFRVTQHAHAEMVAEGIGLDDVLQAIRNAEILEDYPQHRRGPCCLLNGVTEKGRPLHIVCTTAQPVLVLITVYEPKPPRWVTPTQRGK